MIVEERRGEGLDFSVHQWDRRGAGRALALAAKPWSRALQFPGCWTLRPATTLAASWSQVTSRWADGKACPPVSAGTYLSLRSRDFRQKKKMFLGNSFSISWLKLTFLTHTQPLAPTTCQLPFLTHTLNVRGFLDMWPWISQFPSWPLSFPRHPKAVRQQCSPFKCWKEGNWKCWNISKSTSHTPCLK